MNKVKYEQLITSFLDKGYESIYFDELSSKKDQLILRHDVDFDCAYALDMAKIEAGLSVKSTYFVMLSSDSYNIYSPSNREILEKIQKLGHKIGLHFDPRVHGSYLTGLKSELDILSKIIENPLLKIISIHGPNKYFLEYKNPIKISEDLLIQHTYQEEFFTDMPYMSDSMGKFRYGHPLESDAFLENKTIHLLIHPIWWMTKADDSIDKLKEFAKEKDSKMHAHIASHCKPYREYLKNHD